MVIENVAGATGAIGSAQVARAPRDGYTLLTGVGTTTAILKVLKPKLAFDPINDFAPVSLMATFPNILVVRGDFPAGNVKELIDAARANPGKFTYASSGYGSSIHLGAELFKLTTRTDIVHVPYTGSAPAVTALLGGHVDMIFDTMPSIWPSVADRQAARARGREPRSYAGGARPSDDRRDAARLRRDLLGRACWRRPARPPRWWRRSPTRSGASLRIRNSSQSMLKLGAIAASSTPQVVLDLHQQRLRQMAARGEGGGDQGGVMTDQHWRRAITPSPRPVARPRRCARASPSRMPSVTATCSAALVEKPHCGLKHSWSSRR